MKNLMKVTLALAIMGTATGAPLHAQDRDPGGSRIVVQSQTAFAERVGHELNNQLFRIRYPGDHAGVVRVYFTANGHGTAEDIRVIESSGMSWVDRAALRAVGNMDRLGQAPGGPSSGQPVLATIVFARSESELRRLSRDLDEGLDAILASGELDPRVLALTLAAPARS
ncbi:energy transducer TonB family protein [Aurantiacibacter gilvus]|uniref:Energy transducer TonB n=1 Tax=Aurantiacibacter gilvus TaxID=3139141 RepID=A0ABU9IE83_9SPHN